MNTNTDAVGRGLQAAFHNARDLAEKGNLPRAEHLCVEILRSQSDHAEALLLLGVIELQTGRWARAVASIRASVQKNPSQPVALVLLGDALSELPEPQEALRSYEAALRLQPNLPPAHYGRGNALLDLQRPMDAIASYDQALRLQPDHAEAWFNRGNACLRLARYDAAIGSYDRAVQARPGYAAAFNNRGSALLSLKRNDQALASFQAAVAADNVFADAWNNCGSALRELRRPKEALDAIDRALQLRPNYPEAHCNRGSALRELKRSLDAIASYDRAVQLRPDCVEAYRGRGDALLDLRRPEEALAAHDSAVRLRPASADAQNGRGNSLVALRRFAEAMACYDEALRLNPGHAVAHLNRGALLMQWNRRVPEALESFDRALQLDPHFQAALRMRGEALALKQPDSAARSFAELLILDPAADFAAGALFHALQNCADWSASAAAAHPENIRQAVLAGKRADSPFSFLAVTDSAAAQLQCARTYVGHCCSPAGPLWSGERYGHERIRVAYVSGDFRSHAVSYLLAGVFERHDPRRFETIAVSLRAAEPSAFGQRIKAAFSQFIDVSARSDREIAELLKTLEIDIAVDLTGYTQGFRPQIFAFRPAPIQVSYLGYPGTTGAPWMDYVLADSFVIPPDKQQHYSERVVYLPDCFQANDDRRAISDRVSTRTEAGLPENAFVFCCFNNIYKINPRMFGLWMRLLDRTPASVLWLLGSSELVCSNLRREAAQLGVDPGRLVFAAREPYAAHLARLKLADLFLDTSPFNGGTTVSDALWAGLPVITCAGDAFAARMAGSLLRAVGLPDLVTRAVEGYESKALDLALRPRELQALRLRLTEKRDVAPLFDTDRFRRHLESAYEQMWRRHELGEGLASFSVQPLGSVC